MITLKEETYVMTYDRVDKELEAHGGIRVGPIVLSQNRDKYCIINSFSNDRPIVINDRDDAITQFVELANNTINSKDEHDLINALVDKVILIYMEQDYDYVVHTVSSRGELPQGPETVYDMIEFIHRNGLAPDEISSEGIKKAARLIMIKIKDIDNEILDKYLNY